MKTKTKLWHLGHLEILMEKSIYMLRMYGHPNWNEVLFLMRKGFRRVSVVLDVWVLPSLWRVELVSEIKCVLHAVLLKMELLLKCQHDQFSSLCFYVNATHFILQKDTIYAFGFVLCKYLNFTVYLQHSNIWKRLKFWILFIFKCIKLIVILRQESIVLKHMWVQHCTEKKECSHLTWQYFFILEYETLPCLGNNSETSQTDKYFS